MQKLCYSLVVGRSSVGMRFKDQPEPIIWCSQKLAACRTFLGASSMCFRCQRQGPNMYVSAYTDIFTHTGNVKDFLAPFCNRLHDLHVCLGREVPIKENWLQSTQPAKGQNKYLNKSEQVILKNRS